MKLDTIALIGGDKRQLFCAKAFSDYGFRVLLSGFDSLESYGALELVDLDTALNAGDIYILPVTGVKGDIIPCNFSEKEIKIDDKLIKKLSEKPVFMGKASSLKGVNAVDLLKREDFAVQNALPTAEGAVGVAVKSYEGTIFGAKILVIGYGRIGKILSKMLKALNADVTVATRSSVNSAYIKSDGNKAVNTSEIKSISDYDIVFNTADALVIDKNILENSDFDTLIIDLSSYPGGVDFEVADKLGYTAFLASALPGKYSPLSAGKIIADTVLTIIKEEYSWRKRI